MERRQHLAKAINGLEAGSCWYFGDSSEILLEKLLKVKKIRAATKQQSEQEFSKKYSTPNLP